MITQDPLTKGPDDPTVSYHNNIYAAADKMIKGYFAGLDPNKYQNRYVYCSNNPINFTDPLGLEEEQQETNPVTTAVKAVASAVTKAVATVVDKTVDTAIAAEHTAGTAAAIPLAETENAIAGNPVGFGNAAKGLTDRLVDSIQTEFSHTDTLRGAASRIAGQIPYAGNNLANRIQPVSTGRSTSNPVPLDGIYHAPGPGEYYSGGTATEVGMADVGLVPGGKYGAADRITAKGRATGQPVNVDTFSGGASNAVGSLNIVARTAPGIQIDHIEAYSPQYGGFAPSGVDIHGRVKRNDPVLYQHFNNIPKQYGGNGLPVPFNGEHDKVKYRSYPW